jgi:putative phosphoribosyl transferase
VPVAYEVSQDLNLPLDVFIVRKLGVPGYEEFAMGAIANGDVRILNEEVIQQLGIHQKIIEEVTRREEQELKRRNRLYRDEKPFPNLQSQTVILIDDGVATGSTIRAAIEAIRHQHPSQLIVATPVIAAQTYYELQCIVDEVVAILTPEVFYAVGQWYEDFSQTSDEEV